MWDEKEIKELRDALMETLDADDMFHPTEWFVLPSVINTLNAILDDKCIGLAEDHTYNYGSVREVYRRNEKK